MINGKGVFCFPPITVSESGRPPRADRITDHKRQIIIDMEIDTNIRVLVTEDGFFCPIMNKSEKEIEKFLNTIFATIMTKFAQATQISLEDDYAFFKFEDGNNFVEVGGTRSLMSLRNHFEFERDEKETFDFWVQMPRKSILQSELEGFIRQAYNFYQNPEFADDLILIGEAWNLSFDRMHKASFLYSWMIVENMLENTWRKYTDSLKITSKEKDFLKNHSSWSVSHYIQSLAMLGKIDHVTRQTLNKLRQMRNEIVHNRYSVSMDEAWDCMNVACGLIYNKLNFGDSFLSQQTKLSKIPLTYI